jgi:tetratricopeptide (TPR) repeat protein
VLEAAESLTAKSLLRRRIGDTGEARLVMLQSIHEYALYRLLEVGERDELRRRHAHYYLGLAEQAELELVGQGQAVWIRRLETETANLRASFAWALDVEELELVLRAAGALTRFWSVRGQMAEGRTWLDYALARAEDVAPGVRVKALYASGYAALGQGDYEVAADRFGESLALARETGDELGVAMALAQLGWVVAARGNVARAEELSGESLALARALDDPRTASTALGNLADAAVARGDFERAAQLLEESLELRRALADDRNVANALINLGRVELARGRADRAAALLDEGLELARVLGDTWGTSVALSSLAGVDLARGEASRASELLAESLTLCSDRQDRRLAAECLEGMSVAATLLGDGLRAARLAGAAESLRSAAGAILSPVERSLADLRSAVPAGADAAVEQARGASFSFEEALDYALTESATNS